MGGRAKLFFMTGENKLFGTEKNNVSAKNSHALPTIDILHGINREDAGVAAAVAVAIPAIDMLVSKTIGALQRGGRLFYIGAGTSGRLGVLDASECPPTYGVSNDLVQGLIAGGDSALRVAGEGAEDDAQAGAQAVAHLTPQDILVGISASGSAAYVRAAVTSARVRGIYTAAISTAPDSPLLLEADCAILANTGPEYVAGSTRMKSGTAQKMILNMISTAVMIGLGKVYAGFMIDVKISNEKLYQRAVKMIATLSGHSVSEAQIVVADIQDRTATPVKPALVMLLEKCSYDQALAVLEKENGRIDALMRKHNRHHALECL